MGKKISICQPHFIPWQGYFEIIKNCDEFIILDDIKRSSSSNSWQISSNLRANHRSQEIKSFKVKLISKNKNLVINECKLSDDNSELLKKIENVYKKTPYFERYFESMKYAFKTKTNLVELNLFFLNLFLETINCKTTIIKSSEIINDKRKTKLEYILDLLKFRNCKTYLSFLGAKAYNDPALFNKNDIELNYPKYLIKKYDQFYKNKKIEYLPNLSVLDLLFNQGNKSKLFI